MKPAPHAPKRDRFGMHAEDCPCPRCELGNRPTPAQRRNARTAWEQLQLRKKRETEAAAATPPTREGAREQKRQEAAARSRAAQAQADEAIARLSAPVVRPATAEELRELREQFENLRPRRKDGSR